jgi:hypothetical protein
MIKIVAYSNKFSSVWDLIVLNSRAGNFLHLRNYMDYHSERFVDCSVIIERSGKPVAVFPASQHDRTVISHGGLTYGGVLATNELRIEDTLQAFSQMREYYLSLGVEKLIYKAIPYVFQRYPAQEDLYALYRFGAKVARRDVSSVIELGKVFKYSKGRKWSINKGKKAGIDLRSCDNFSSFHNLLSSVLIKFNAIPTHSLAELVLLHSKFPNQIILYEALLGSELLAGAVIFDFGDTVHAQYLAASDNGREIGALDYLLAHLIENIYNNRSYFSFGISTEDSGQGLNAGLIAQKEGFGARTVVHDFYDWIL